MKMDGLFAARLCPAIKVIARALIDALKELARERGARSIFLLTNEANEAAMKLYAATGAKRANEDDVLWSYDL